MRVSEIRVKRIRVNQGLGVFHEILGTLQGHPTRSPIYLRQRSPPLPLRSGNHTYNMKYGPAPKPLGYQNKCGLISKDIFCLVPSSKKCAKSMSLNISSLISRHLFENKISIKHGLFAE